MRLGAEKRGDLDGERSPEGVDVQHSGSGLGGSEKESDERGSGSRVDEDNGDDEGKHEGEEGVIIPNGSKYSLAGAGEGGSGGSGEMTRCCWASAAGGMKDGKYRKGAVCSSKGSDDRERVC